MSWNRRWSRVFSGMSWEKVFIFFFVVVVVFFFGCCPGDMDHHGSIHSFVYDGFEFQFCLLCSSCSYSYTFRVRVRPKVIGMSLDLDLKLKTFGDGGDGRSGIQITLSQEIYGTTYIMQLACRSCRLKSHVYSYILSQI